MLLVCRRPERARAHDGPQHRQAGSIFFFRRSLTRPADARLGVRVGGNGTTARDGIGAVGTPTAGGWHGFCAMRLDKGIGKEPELDLVHEQRQSDSLRSSLPASKPARREPPAGTTFESWKFVERLRAERRDHGLPIATIGLSVAKKIASLITDSGLDEELWFRVPRNMAITEARFGVSFRQLLMHREAGIMFEAFCDGPWERNGDGDHRRIANERQAASTRAQTVDLGMADAARSMPDRPSDLDLWRAKQAQLDALKKLEARP